ncbi:glycosyltransferase [Gluconobacter sp. Dm-62]|uniref:glycosyltransferase n=1 Tax=Gluconobacter sp. Dm-62 TaxID=2799804 RepID=UPI001B8AB160|nr:glycosyltransferase [Gluconobacter sp. Dm-62]MBS1103335.1 glycosyltransferase [Gluconobacter sp. Dm-62]
MTHRPLLGFIDNIDRYRVRGWAREDGSAEPVLVQLVDHGVVLAEKQADEPRPDAGGNFGFEFLLPFGLSEERDHHIEVRHAADGSLIGRTPWVLGVEAQPSSRTLSGHIDYIDHDRIRGWAVETGEDGRSVALEIFDNGRLLTSVIANGRRADVAAVGLGDGRCGFDILLPASLPSDIRHSIDIRRASDGMRLAGSPVVLEPAEGLNDTFRQTVSRAVAAVASLRDLAVQEEALAFFRDQTDRVAQGRIETLSRQDARKKQRQKRRMVAEDIGETAFPKRALVIDARVPVSNRDAGSCAVLSHMHGLRENGYEVSFMAADEMHRRAEDYDALRKAGFVVYRSPYDTSVEDVLRAQSGTFDLVYLHRQTIVSRYLALVRHMQPKAMAVYSVADLHHIRLQRQGEVQERPELLSAARQMRLLECTSAWMADAVITHSAAEAKWLQKAVPESKTFVVPWHVPVRGRPPAFGRRAGVLFVGDYSHAPNLDAAYWILEDIAPRLHKIAPHVTLMLAGSNMPASLAASSTENVEIMGHVADLSGLLGKIRVGIAPLRFGAGVKGKVLECLAASVPCIMTPIAAEGISLPPELDCLVATDVEQFVQLIVQYHDEEEAYRSAAQVARTFVRDNYSDGAVQNALSSVIKTKK